MKIENVLSGVEILSYHNFSEKTKKVVVSNICDNSCDKNLKNSLFVCIEGYNFDSHTKVSELEKKGVKFFVCEKVINTTFPFVVVKSTRKALPIICDNFYHHPTKNFALIGIVGTNGKTTTSHFIKSLVDYCGKKCSVIGTSGVFVNGKKYPETLTTPDPIILYKIFDKIRKNKSDVTVMEISAHAIKLEKVNNLVFDELIFTNFSQDHLDFFKTMEEYKKTKISFFNTFNAKSAIINLDDDVGKEIYYKIRDKIPCTTFGQNIQSDFCFSPQKTTLFGTNFVLKFNCFYAKFFDKKDLIFNEKDLYFNEKKFSKKNYFKKNKAKQQCKRVCVSFFSRVPCEFNLYNLVGAMIGVIKICDFAKSEQRNFVKNEQKTIKFCVKNSKKTNEICNNFDIFDGEKVVDLYNKNDEISEKVVDFCEKKDCFNGFLITKKMIESVKILKGRFDLIKTQDGKNILIDFAHTPKSLQSLFENIKKLSDFDIVAVLGCPGNRDETKREIMGEICHKYCKRLYITSDNPCFENPLIIASEIKKGAKEKGEIIENRKLAIKKAIKLQGSNEILCIIGKGSENYQDINGKKCDYSDYIEVEKCIKKPKKQ